MQVRKCKLCIAVMRHVSLITWSIVCNCLSYFCKPCHIKALIMIGVSGGNLASGIFATVCWGLLFSQLSTASIVIWPLLQSSIIVRTAWWSNRYLLLKQPIRMYNHRNYICIQEWQTKFVCYMLHDFWLPCEITHCC